MIELTDNAAEEIKRIQQMDNKEGWSLRLAVQSGGCAGMTYAMNFEETPKPDDKTMEIKDVKVVIDPRSDLYINGLVLDFSKEMLGGGFKFNNPNAVGGCGCGTSFRV
jgi:iron-sulfur cluster assembly protein